MSRAKDSGLLFWIEVAAWLIIGSLSIRAASSADTCMCYDAKVFSVTVATISFAMAAVMVLGRGACSLHRGILFLRLMAILAAVILSAVAAGKADKCKSREAMKLSYASVGIGTAVLFLEIFAMREAHRSQKN